MFPNNELNLQKVDFENRRSKRLRMHVQIFYIIDIALCLLI